jgi:uncharacterized membrane protein
MTEPAAKPDPPPRTGWTDAWVEQVIGNLLRAGVMLAAVVVAAGGILYLVQEGGGPIKDKNLQEFRGEQKLRVLDIVMDAGQFHSAGLIELGLLLLILTPIARVIFSIAAFALERDRMYVVITTLVLVILLYSLFSGHIH